MGELKTSSYGDIEKREFVFSHISKKNYIRNLLNVSQPKNF